MAYRSPNTRATPGPHDYYYEDKYVTPSPTPSPRGQPYYFAQTPQRPATRAHFRHPSSGAFDYGTPRTPSFSPRYTSDGQYATANVSSSRSTRKHYSQTAGPPPPRRERRHSTSYYRPSDSHGESDEDEYIEINGITYVLPARSKSKRKGQYYTVKHGRHDTDYRYHAQGGHYLDRDIGYNSPRYEPRYEQPRREPERRPSVAPGHSRRNSSSVPQRPQTVRPVSTHKKAVPVARKATEEDARKHGIPPGYSLKNWDPDEEPVLLLGSVFDANSVGKWIYDWTVFKYGSAHPMSEMAGDMWLLLIKLAGKLKHAEQIAPDIRSDENREMVEDFIESGERLWDKMRKLIKTCEAPMLKANKKGPLGSNSGVEFVNTMYGRERELEKTEAFMANVRIWNLRYDANCEEVLSNPTM